MTMNTVLDSAVRVGSGERQIVIEEALIGLQQSGSTVQKIEDSTVDD